VIGKEVAHYKILDRLGGGGMGVVYKAEDTRLGRIVALKFLNTELLSNESVRRRFLHEAKAASSIDHPNVCHVYEVGDADGRTFMAMSYCEGRSLREVIKGGPAAPREAFSIAFGIAQGLWAAHRRGIVHRDIKPANVILTDDGFVRIVDFGLALLIGDSRVTTSGVTVGTVAYMSPEQTSGSAVAANTDIWSLGVTLYELLTGRLPFRGEVNAALVYSIVHEPHTPLLELNSAVPPQCVRIIDRCLEKDPAKRYPTIEALLEDMVSVAHELGWESSVASATIAPILRERRRKILTRRVAVCAAAIALVLGVWGIYHKLHGPASPYVTKVRLAVFPLDNMIGAENQTFVNGLSDHLARVARWAAHRTPSMWTAPYLDVVAADLPGPTAAADAFGVNRVLTGDVQRYRDSYQLNLKVFDAKSGRRLATRAIAFRLEAPGPLMSALPAAMTGFFGARIPEATHSPWSCSDPGIIRSYLEGIASLQNARESSDSAVVFLNRAVDRDSSFAALVCAAGTAEMYLFRKKGETRLRDSALRHGQRARALSPDLPEADILVGDAFRRMEAVDSAETYYRRAVVADPGYITPRQRLIGLLESQKRVDEAEGVIRDYANTYPDLWASHRTLGVFYFGRGRIEEAAAAWDSALTFAPRDPVTLNNLGAVYHRDGNWAKARELFLRSFQAKPNCESSSNVATTLYFDGKYDESAKYFEFALEYCDTTNHAAWGDLARALYWAPTDRPRALRLYAKALDLARGDLEKKPDDVELMSYVVDYASMVDDIDGARLMIDRVKPLLKDEDRAMYRIGAAYEKIGQREAALDMLGNAMRHGFPVPEIRGDPMLRSLIADSRFQEMVRTEAAAVGAEAAHKTH
jgi:serine/threonine-protein kinase